MMNFPTFGATRSVDASRVQLTLRNRSILSRYSKNYSSEKMVLAKFKLFERAVLTFALNVLKLIIYSFFSSAIALRTRSALSTNIQSKIFLFRCSGRLLLFLSLPRYVSLTTLLASPYCFLSSMRVAK
jgi:hypothetical protein